MTTRERAAQAPQTAILAIGVGLAARSESVEEAGAGLSLAAGQARMFRRLFGLDRLAFAPEEPLRPLLERALADLDEQAAGRRDGVALVLHCHTIPNIAPTPVSPVADLDLRLAPDGERMGLTMSHCATGLSALAVASARLAPGETGLILVGEKAFHPRIRLVADTTIMAEGAVAVLVGRGEGPIAIEGVHATHDGACSISRGHPGEEAALPASYPAFLEGHLRAALDRFGIGVDGLALVAPHNVNVVSWIAAARALGLPRERLFLANVARLGHCFGADPFVNLRDALEAGLAMPGDRVLLTSVGMGATAVSVLVRVDDFLPARPSGRATAISPATEDTPT